MTTPPELVLFIGRFHPLLVHLPVALVLLLATLELLARSPRFRHANANSGILLAITVPAALLAALCGWLLSLEGGYHDQLLKWHKWTGIALGLVCVLAALLYRLELKKPYRWTLAGGVLVLFVSTHFGGSLTHGSDYLVRYAPGPFRTWLAGAAEPTALPPSAGASSPLPVFATAVQPIFQQHCVSCHGAEKAKAGLRLDTLEAAQKGGETGPGIVPGKPGESLVLKRMRLPLSHDDHMPPDGKSQPKPAELDLIEWWIRDGGRQSLDSQQLKTNTSIPATAARLLHEKLGIASETRTVAPQPLDQVLPAAAKLSAELNIQLSALGAGQPWLQANASLAGTNFGDAELSKLAAVGLNLRWLDLGGTGVSDAGLELLAKMPHLTRLHLERTAITDSALRHVAGLAGLEYLNLHHTAVTDVGLESLKPLPNLRRVFLWETQVSPEAAKTLSESLRDDEQVARWQEEIEQLQARVRHAQVTVDVGAPVAAPATNSPANTICPVSGKSADAAKSLVQDGKLIAFCCDDCKAKFQQDPKTYLSKLQPIAPKETARESGK